MIMQKKINRTGKNLIPAESEHVSNNYRFGF